MEKETRLRAPFSHTPEGGPHSGENPSVFRDRSKGMSSNEKGHLGNKLEGAFKARLKCRHLAGSLSHKKAQSNEMPRSKE